MNKELFLKGVMTNYKPQIIIGVLIGLFQVILIKFLVKTGGLRQYSLKPITCQPEKYIHIFDEGRDFCHCLKTRRNGNVNVSGSP